MFGHHEKHIEVKQVAPWVVLMSCLLGHEGMDWVPFNCDPQHWLLASYYWRN